MESKFINIVKNILLVTTILSIVPLVMSFVYLKSSIDVYETIENDTMIVSAIGTVITCFVSTFVTLALFIAFKELGSNVDVYNASFNKIRRQFNSDNELKNERQLNSDKELKIVKTESVYNYIKEHTDCRMVDIRNIYSFKDLEGILNFLEEKGRIIYNREDKTYKISNN